MFEKDLYRTLARNLPGFGIFLFDHSFRFVMVAGDDLLSKIGLIETDLLGRTLDQTEFPATSSAIEIHFRAALEGDVRDLEIERDGRVLAIRLAPVKSSAGHISSGMLTCHDVTDTVRAREALRALSLTDELTGIYNRRGFQLLANQQLKLADRSCTGALLFFIDLNDLKLINDNIGHDAGDDALRAATTVLTSTFRESDIIARYGGDEFVVFTTEVPREMDHVFRDRLQKATVAFNEANPKFRLSLSVGSSYYDPEDPNTLDQLVVDADREMYDNKNYRRRNGSSGNMPAVRIASSNVSAKFAK